MQLAKVQESPRPGALDLSHCSAVTGLVLPKLENSSTLIITALASYPYPRVYLQIL